MFVNVLVCLFNTFTQISQCNFFASLRLNFVTIVQELQHPHKNRKWNNLFKILKEFFLVKLFHDVFTQLSLHFRGQIFISNSVKHINVLIEIFFVFKIILVFSNIFYELFDIAGNKIK